MIDLALLLPASVAALAVLALALVAWVLAAVWAIEGIGRMGDAMGKCKKGKRK